MFVDESERAAFIQACDTALAVLPTPCKEYHILQYLNQHQQFAFLPPFSATLALFYKHFLLMHALYTLQRKGLQEGRYLSISPVAIHYQAVSASDSQALSLYPGQKALAEYYLDLKHLEEASEDTVFDLMADFWKRFAALETAPEAYQILEVSPTASFSEIERAYRLKVNATHPDKGGSAEAFVRVQEAYEVMKKHKSQ